MPGKNRPEMTAEQALRAIEARIQGKFDDPDLKAFGPLWTDSEQDILDLIEAAKAPAPPDAAACPKSSEDVNVFRQLAKEFDRIAKSGAGGEAARLARLGGDAIFTLVGVVERLQAGKTPAVDPGAVALETAPGSEPENYASIVEALREAKSGLIAFTGGESGACRDTILKINAALEKISKAPASPEAEDLGLYRGISEHFSSVAKSGSGGTTMNAQLASDTIFTLIGIIDRLQGGKKTLVIDAKVADEIADYLENEIQNCPESYGNTDEAMGRWNRAVATLRKSSWEGPQSLSNIDAPTARDIAAYLENEFENSKDIEPETLHNWRGVVNALREIGESAPVLPEIAVVIDGGVVQFVVSSDPAAIGQHVRIVDYDTEGVDPASLFEIPLLGEPHNVLNAATWLEEVTETAFDLTNIRKVKTKRDPQP